MESKVKKKKRWINGEGASAKRVAGICQNVAEYNHRSSNIKSHLFKP